MRRPARPPSARFARAATRAGVGVARGSGSGMRVSGSAGSMARFCGRAAGVAANGVRPGCARRHR